MYCRMERITTQPSRKIPDANIVIGVKLNPVSAKTPGFFMDGRSGMSQLGIADLLLPGDIGNLVNIITKYTYIW